MPVNSGATPAAFESAGPKRSSHLRARIVVAEDDEEMRRLITLALRKDGHDVTEVADGMRLLVHVVAREAEPERAFDLIISDLRIPVSSGLQVLRGLRRSGWKVPFILCSAFGDESTRAEAEKLGAIYFDKPFELDDLRKVVRGIFSMDEEAR